MKGTILRNWFVLTVMGETSLAGYVYNDPRADGTAFVDGHRLTTSEIKILDRANNICQTRNTLYFLEDEQVLTKEFGELYSQEGRELFEELLPRII